MSVLVLFVFFCDSLVFDSRGLVHPGYTDLFIRVFFMGNGRRTADKLGHSIRGKETPFPCSHSRENVHGGNVATHSLRRLSLKLDHYAAVKVSSYSSRGRFPAWITAFAVRCISARWMGFKDPTLVSFTSFVSNFVFISEFL
ncbi:hypothetical protein Tcan_00886, partial [Toxocara canis]